MDNFIKNGDSLYKKGKKEF